MFWPSKEKKEKKRHLKGFRNEGNEHQNVKVPSSPPLSFFLPSLSQLDPDVVASLPLPIRKELEMEYRKAKAKENVHSTNNCEQTLSPQLKGAEKDVGKRQKTLQEIGCVSKSIENGGDDEDGCGDDGGDLFHQLDQDLLFALPSQVIEENLKVIGHNEKDIQKTLQTRRTIQKKKNSEVLKRDEEDSFEGNGKEWKESEKCNGHPSVSTSLFFQSEKIDLNFRSLIQKWMTKTSSPSLLHRTLLSLYLHQLVIENNLEDLHRILIFINRFSHDCPQWKEEINLVTKEIQKKICDLYHSTLRLENFN